MSFLHFQADGSWFFLEWYNLKFSLPTYREICDNHKGELIIRSRESRARRHSKPFKINANHKNDLTQTAYDNTSDLFFSPLNWNISTVLSSLFSFVTVKTISFNLAAYLSRTPPHSGFLCVTTLFLLFALLTRNGHNIYTCFPQRNPDLPL